MHFASDASQTGQYGFIAITSEKQFQSALSITVLVVKGRCFIVSINRYDRLFGCRVRLRTHRDGKPSERVACADPTPEPTWKTES